jgi:tubulin beta
MSVVSVAVGRGGCYAAEAYVQELCLEHGVAVRSGRAQLGSTEGRAAASFYEGRDGRLVPRSVLCDPAGLEWLGASPAGSLLDPRSLVSGQGPSGTWAQGYFGRASVELLEGVRDAVRLQAEACDALLALALSHSCGGGGGSGVDSLVVEALRDEYLGGPSLWTASVLPFGPGQGHALEPYDAGLTLSRLGLADAVLLFDLAALSRSAVAAPKATRAPQLVARALASATCGMRFATQPTFGLRKLATNLVPFPATRLLVAGQAARHAHDEHGFGRVLRAAMGKDSWLLSCGSAPAHLLAAVVLVRGPGVDVLEAGAELARERARHGDGDGYEYGLPDVLVAACATPAPHVSLSATVFANSAAVARPVEALADQFEALLRRKAFVHWYETEGMEATELDDALQELTHIVAAYRGAGEDPLSGGLLRTESAATAAAAAAAATETAEAAEAAPGELSLDGLSVSQPQVEPSPSSRTKSPTSHGAK